MRARCGWAWARRCARRRAISKACRPHASLLEYRMPTMAESPPIEVHIVESHDPYGPFGAKEASEGALAGFPPALVNAIANAIGIDLDELPVTPDRVIDALSQRRRAARLAADHGPQHDRPLAEFRLAQPGTVDEAVAARRNIRAAASSPAAPTCSSTCGAASAARICSSTCPASNDLPEIAIDGDRRHASARASTLATLARDPRDRRRYRGARRSRRCDRRPRPSRHGDARRQPVPRYPLHLLQPERMVAQRQRLLSQESRRHMSCRAAGQALPRRL